MPFADDVSTYRFRLLGPRFRASKDGRFRLPRANGRAATVLESPQLVLAANNAYLGSLEAELKGPLRAAGASAACTLAYGAVVNAAVRHMSGESALVTLGTGGGFVTRAALLGNEGKIHLDRESFRGSAAPEIGVLVHNDGLSYRQHLESLHAADPFLADDCVLIMGGTNADAPRRAAFDFVRGSRRSWRVVLDERTAGEHPTLGNGLLAFQAGPRTGMPVVIETETGLAEPVRVGGNGRSAGPPRVTVLHYRSPWVGIQDYPNLEVLALEDGASLREAFEASTGDYVVVLDADVPLTSDAVSEAVRAAEGASGARRRVLGLMGRRRYDPIGQGEYFPSNETRFDDTRRPQTVTVAPAPAVRRDNLVSLDLDPELDDVAREVAVRLGQGWQLEGPSARCSRVPGGIVAGRVGAVLTPYGRWLVESVGTVSRAWPDLALDDRGRVRPNGPLLESDEDVATVVCERRREWWTANFGHWTLEVLTRVAILMNAGIPRRVKLLVPEPILQFQRDTLIGLGVDKNRILPWDGTPTRFRTVYVPTAHPTPPFVFPAGIELLRDLARQVRRTPPWRRLFISRRHLERTKRISNEDDLFRVAADFGFVALEPERITYALQLKWFAEAQIVVGAHGSGLANAAFMAPGTGVCELAPAMLSAAKVPNFWDLAACGRQPYGLCVANGRRIDPARFRRVLRDVVLSQVR